MRPFAAGKDACQFADRAPNVPDRAKYVWRLRSGPLRGGNFGQFAKTRGAFDGVKNARCLGVARCRQNPAFERESFPAFKRMFENLCSGEGFANSRAGDASVPAVGAGECGRLSRTAIKILYGTCTPDFRNYADMSLFIGETPANLCARYAMIASDGAKGIWRACLER